MACAGGVLEPRLSGHATYNLLSANKQLENESMSLDFIVRASLEKRAGKVGKA
jgi:hypothetical protein